MNYAAKQLKVKNLLGKHGQDVVLHSITRTSSNPAKPWEVTPTESTSTVKAVLLPVSDSLDRSTLPNTTTTDELSRVLLAAYSLAHDPVIGDYIVDAAGLKWTFVSITKLAPAAITILFDGIVKR